MSKKVHPLAAMAAAWGPEPKEYSEDCACIKCCAWAWFYIHRTTPTKAQAEMERRIVAYEVQGMTRSDAQGVVEAEDLQTQGKGA